MIFLHFYKVDNLFMHQSYFKNTLPGKINLIKIAKNHFLLLKISQIPKVPSSRSL